MKLYLICGHGAGDPGACGNGYEEAERVRVLASRIKALGGDEIEILDPSRNWYADNGISYLSLPDDAQLVELHMDAAEGARGAHVIYCARFDPDEYDIALANAISEIFPGRANRLVGRSDLANPNRAANKGISYRLVENGFITSWEDVNIFNSRMDDIARAYLAVFGIAINDAPAPSPTPEPAPAPEPDDSSSDGDFHGGEYRCMVNYLRVRDAPSLSGREVAHYDAGEIVVLDDWYTVVDGYVWGRYTGYSGAVRYIAVGPHTGKAEADDYLVEVG